ncbi:DUF397 domain-containing protein [Saccharothrix longispora]|uniref:DUF397 domain-containing protein n=1 Tax=Saccharothrix longispora TaxID=33920 RepID=A0ABU1Q5A1_9PSEU|nr:DUF397 domain-containing protein [Saccharothrix longispora]MDR6598073.1 hypothetical protein [Saccharothrix longispora]
MSEWRKSSRSATETNCVEVAHVDRRVAVRDSKNQAGPVLTFDRGAAASFLGWIKGA